MRGASRRRLVKCEDYVPGGGGGHQSVSSHSIILAESMRNPSSSAVPHLESADLDPPFRLVSDDQILESRTRIAEIPRMTHLESVLIEIAEKSTILLHDVGWHDRSHV